MIDLPPELPEPYPAPTELVVRCSKEAADFYGLPHMVMMAVIEAEGGRVGTVSKNTDGSYDLGVMQINTINLPEIQEKFNLQWQDLAYKPCVNIAVGAWFLAKRVKSAPDLWTGVGNYHSYTTEHHVKYRRKITRIYQRLISST